MMRRRIPYRVCSCTPQGVVTHLEARLLRQLVNREIHPLRCAASCKQKYLKGSRLGDLCAETGHFLWAMRLWKLTEWLIYDKDYEEWLDVWFDGDRVQLSDVVSESECELLARRRSDLWRALGFPEEAWWDAETEQLASTTSGFYYSFFWLEKYDFDPESHARAWQQMLRDYEAEQETARIFREGLN